MELIQVYDSGREIDVMRNLHSMAGEPACIIK